MQIRSKKYFSVICIIVLVFTASCTRNVKESRIITENARLNFVFASDASEFKDSIRNKLIARYKDQCNIDIVNIGKLKDIRTENYDVVLIMDTCMAWSTFNPSLKSFLENQTNHNNIVLFMTANDLDWEYRYKGVDAITSASEIENEESVYLELAEKIDKIISD